MMANWHKLVAISSLLTVFFLGGCSLVAKVPTLFQSREEVAEIAKEITVKIEGCGEASGVIYERDGNTYSVLTAYHILVREDLTCLILTPDGKAHRVDAPMIQPVSGVDLGILRFTSNNSYAVGELGDSNKAVEGKTIYVAGAPQGSEAIPNRTVIIGNGTIVGRTTQPRDGYALIYDALTRPGMSGGPVLNDRAIIIGIHGRADRDQRDEKTGFNLGIPIQVFLSSQDYSSAKGANTLIPARLWATLLGVLVAGVWLLGGRGNQTKKTPSSSKTATKANKSQTQENQRWAGLVQLENESAVTANKTTKSKKAAAPQTNDAQSYFKRANDYFDQRKYQKAIADYSKAIEFNPNDADTYNNRGIAYRKQGEYQKAIVDYNKAIELNPNYALAYNNRGWADYNQGEYERAILDYNKAIELNPNYANAYKNRGAAYEKREEYERAIADYSKAIELNPNDPNLAEVYYNRGNAYGIRGEYQRAIADYNKAIKLNPNYATAHNSRGILYSIQGEYQRAIADFNKAIELNPDYANAYKNRSFAYYNQGDYQRAIADDNKAIELNPDYANAYYNRGLVHKLNGDKQWAIKDFQKAADLYRKQVDRQWYHKALHQLEESILELNRANNPTKTPEKNQ